MDRGIAYIATAAVLLGLLALAIVPAFLKGN